MFSNYDIFCSNSVILAFRLNHLPCGFSGVCPCWNRHSKILLSWPTLNRWKLSYVSRWGWKVIQGTVLDFCCSLVPVCFYVFDVWGCMKIRLTWKKGKEPKQFRLHFRYHYVTFYFFWKYFHTFSRFFFFKLLLRAKLFSLWPRVLCQYSKAWKWRPTQILPERLEKVWWNFCLSTIHWTAQFVIRFGLTFFCMSVCCFLRVNVNIFRVVNATCKIRRWCMVPTEVVTKFFTMAKGWFLRIFHFINIF